MCERGQRIDGEKSHTKGGERKVRGQSERKPEITKKKKNKANPETLRDSLARSWGSGM